MKYGWLMSATLFACANEAPVMDTTLTSAGMYVGVDQASEQIVADRCNRQLSCGNIGKGHRWNDRRHCAVDAKPRVESTLGASCSSIDAARLATCLNEIRDQRCAETASMPVTCEGLALCR
jgi:hypothetical protein